MTDLKDNPSNITDYLIQDNGVGGAIQAAHDGTTKAQQDSDKYALAISKQSGELPGSVSVSYARKANKPRCP